MATASSIQISIESRQLGNDQVESVDARELHSVLGVGRDYSSWIKNRIKGYGFEEGVDFVLLSRAPKWASENFDSLEQVN